ncbi:MAG: hypothetical protein CMN80_14515 [Spongiibacter sp.]|nr:hypothetical protein [Spongiibacter sp.]
MNSGLSRQEHWNQYIGRWWFFRLFTWAGIILMGYAAYEYLEHDKLNLVAGFLGLYIYLLAGSKKLGLGQQLRIAKKGEVCWWRNNRLN